MSKIFSDIEHQFDMLSCMISQLSDENYMKRGNHINSIGSHVRHVLEYVQILITADLNESVDYSKRQRDINIETKRTYALEFINELKGQVVKADHPVSILEESEILQSSYLREMLYMHEHIVHHCAILRVELESLDEFKVDPCFGFAKSTLKHLESHVSA